MITQTFYYDWSAGTSTRSGYPAGMHWQYQNYNLYDQSQGNLKSVTVSLDLNVSGLNEGDTFSYRNSFFSGWSTTLYQLYNSNTLNALPADGAVKNSWVFTAESDLDKWTNLLYGSSGHVYLETSALAASYTISGTQEVIYDYTDDVDASPETAPMVNLMRFSRPYIPEPSPVPEPSTFLLLAAGLAGAGWLSRRSQSARARK